MMNIERNIEMNIERNLNEIRERVAKAAIRVGRKPEEISIAAVTKTVTIKEVAQAAEAGATLFAENRVQSLLAKLSAIESGGAINPENPINPEQIELLKQAQWHLIGHLQTNKVKYIIDKVSLIHSVDSVHLAKEIGRLCMTKGMTMDCLLEINVSGEESKQGIAPEEVEDFLEKFTELEGVKLKGLMTMAPLDATEKEKHKIFSTLYKIGIDIQRQNMHNVGMSIFSMGMSGDFEEAIEEGSTLIRVGTGIFH